MKKAIISLLLLFTINYTQADINIIIPNNNYQHKVAICILNPFNNIYAEIGINEKISRQRVKEKCEKSLGEDSIFCRAKEAKCEYSWLYIEK